jgi:hydroxyethylthiazole kinase-like uncharacterized protein yjeF
VKVGYSAAQIRQAEGPLLERGVALMQRAAQALSDHIVSVLPDASTARVVLLAGSGDNGGDAAYAASYLVAAGVRAEVIAVAGSLHSEAEEAARNAGAEIIADADPASVAARIPGADVVVDGILGIAKGGRAAGGDPALREPVRSVVVAVKGALAKLRPDPLVIAVDIPSGIDPDDGSVPDPDAVLRAHLTVTFIGMKAGLLLDPAKSLAGKVWLEPIGAMQGLLGLTPPVQLP